MLQPEYTAEKILAKQSSYGGIVGRLHSRSARSLRIRRFAACLEATTWLLRRPLTSIWMTRHWFSWG